jgi:endoglucanase
VLKEGQLNYKGSSGVVGTGLPGEFGVTYQFINEATVDVYVDQNKVSL